MKGKTPFWRTYVTVAVAALVGYFAWQEYHREDKPEEPKEKVLGFEKAKVLSLTLEATDSETVRVAREGDAWKLTAPFEAPADSREVDSLLGSLESLEVEDVASAAPANLGDFGLASPKTTVSLMVEGQSEPRKVLLGAKTPDGNAVYAKLPDQPRVFTIPSHLESSLAKKPFDLRDRDLLHVKRDAVKTLEIQGPEGSYALARDEKGEWAFTRPLATRAGRWSVDGLLGTLENLRMESIAAEEVKDLGDYGLARPARTVTLGLADGTTKTLEIGSSPEDKKYHAREASRSLVAVIPGALVEDLAKGMSELRAKRLLEVATYEVTGFDAEAGGTKRTYEKTTTKDKDGIENASWKRTAPDAKDLETNKVQDVLFQVGGLEAVEFVDQPAALESYGLASPALKATLRHAEGKPAVWFEVGEKDGAYYGRRIGDGSILKLDPKKAADLVKAFGEL